MLDGEAVLDRRRLAFGERQLPRQLAEVGLLGRIRAGLAQPDLDLAIGRHRDMVVHAELCGAWPVAAHGCLVADVDGPAAADDRLAGCPAVQLAFDPDPVVDAELQLELLAGSDGLQAGFARELAVAEHPGRTG